MIQHYDTLPARFETVRSTGIMTTVIRLSIVEVEDGFEADEVYYNHREALTLDKDYGGIIAAIVRSKYSVDDMEAIVNNYLQTKTAAHKATWKEMQAWRTLAKETAETILTNESE